MKSMAFVAVAVALLGGLAIVAAERSERHGASAAPFVAAPAITVTSALTDRRDLAVTIEVVGRAEAKASVPVKARVDGQVAEVSFQEGRPVHKGQLLFRLDTSVLEAQVRQSEAVLGRDQAQLAKSRSDQQRNESLARQGFISPSGLAQTQADVQAAQATFEADRAALDNARLQLGFGRIASPVDGIAGVAQVTVGGAVKANDTTLVVVNQVQPIYVTFAVPEVHLGALKTAMSAGPVHVIGHVGDSGPSVTGTIAFIDNAVDVASGSITAKALFDNRDQNLTAGQFVRAQVQVGQRVHVLTVPSQAVENGVDGPFTFVVLADSTVQLRPLKIGAQSAGRTVVTSGLSEGERVVTSGQARLRDKGRVNVVPDAAAAS
jgi:multidrug efflux system membrane fusion protein